MGIRMWDLIMGTDPDEDNDEPEEEVTCPVENCAARVPLPNSYDPWRCLQRRCPEDDAVYAPSRG